ncbi:hypothetical protein KWG64_19665 [Rahnella sp. PD12R]|uniref:hypothetical protein n=1 Tax=Rahnella sp. PD12R TaxID=2855688 RepID=UPI001C442288|nr:hypothetical protein [Rahnella sp. PD12R]MBV6820170.1 hypothetical protein [Rahnella sp. PD12R]
MNFFEEIRKTSLLTIASLLVTHNAFSFELTVSITDGGVVTINSHNKIINIKTNTFITGYSVNCSASKFIAWGHPKILNKNNPQDSTLILFDIKNNQTIGKKSLSKGIFGIEFLASSNNVYIDSDPGSIVNTNTGDIVTTEPDYYLQNNELFEKCTKDESWEFNRYPQE